MKSATVILLVLLSGLASAQAAARSLLAGYPLPLPDPFNSPKEIAEAARAAAGSPDAFTTNLCSIIGRKDIQGTRRPIDTSGVKLWPIFSNLARTATVYPDTIETLGQVLAKCNSMGGLEAEGAGYGVAYIYAEGWVESEGITNMLESAYSKGGGCSAIGTIMDIAAAVSKARDVALDELHNVMATYSTDLQACTPKDDAQKFKAYSLTGEKDEVKPRGSLHMPPADDQATAGGAQDKAAAGGSSSQAGSSKSGSSGGSTGSKKFSVVWELAHSFLPRVRVSP